MGAGRPQYLVDPTQLLVLRLQPAVFRGHLGCGSVENALAEHPDVVDNAVVGIPDEQFGQRLAAFIVPRPNSDIDEAAVRQYLKDKVSRAEQPRDIHIVTDIPRNPLGKVLRSQLFVKIS